MGPLSLLRKSISCLIRRAELAQPRERDELGVWRAHSPYPDASIHVHRVNLPSIVPAYMEPWDGQWTEAGVPPSVWQAMQPGQHPRLWGKHGGDPALEVQAVLNQLAACLYPRARSRWRELDGTNVPMEPLGDAFRFPLADAVDPTRPACMWLDPVLVSRSTGIFKHMLDASTGSGYTTLDLCKTPSPERWAVREYAHRFVYWAMRGAPRPPLSWGSAVLLHICQDAKCINPLHMRWGTQGENMAQAFGEAGWGHI
jgi:hypothetical protein